MIRPATLADVPTLLALLRAMAEYERLADRFGATEDALAPALFGAAPVAHAALAERDGETAGFALWTFSFASFRCERVLFVEDVFVTEAARGSGLGYALFGHLAREALAQGCARMDWHVLDWNAPALRFYDRLGAAAPASVFLSRQLDGAALTRLAESGRPEAGQIVQSAET